MQHGLQSESANGFVPVYFIDVIMFSETLEKLLL